MKRLLGLSLLCCSLAPSYAARIQNDTVRVDADGGAVCLSVRDAGGWRALLESAPEPGGHSFSATATAATDASSGADTLRTEQTVPGGRVRTVFTLGPGRVHVVSRLTLTAPRDVEAFQAGWRFVPDGKPGKPDATWTSNLRPNTDELIGQHAFRSPAVVVQQGRMAAVLLPDLAVLSRNWRTLPATLDLDVTPAAGPLLTYALETHHTVRHVYWRHEPGETKRLPAGTVSLAYDLLLSPDAPPRQAYRSVARWWWEHQGHENLADTLPQAVPWRGYVQAGYDAYLPRIWREADVAGKPVGGASMDSWGYPNATWFQCWFNDLRSAYGTYLWGKWLIRPDLVEKARRTRGLLLSSPQKEGLFPVIYDWNRKAWDGSTAGGGPRIYHAADCAWAAYWLLMWHQDLEKSPESVRFAKRLGDFFVRAQKPSGEIPAYYDMDTLRPTDRLVGGAETSGCGMFLALLGRVTGEAKYMDAARKAAAYLRREVIPTNRWFDYETFYSCSGKPESFFDSRTGQNPQNNLSIQWAVELFRQLYMSDRQTRDLRDGEALLDYLNLYQQVWSPPYLTFAGFGGYGVQNTDAEWNDARQAQFACTNLDYYRLTGKAEYMERAIAAARAGFATTYMSENAFVSPRTYAKTPIGHADENYGHSGVDAPAGPTSWDWGTGSALTTAAYLRREYGDVWVDADHGRAFGINGVTAVLTGDRLDIRSSIQTLAPVLVRGEGRALPKRLVVNGTPRALTPADWKAGWTAMPLAAYRVRHRAPEALSADDAAIVFEVWPLRSAAASVSYTVHGADGSRRTGMLPAQPVRRSAQPVGGEGRYRATFPADLFRPGVQTLSYRIGIVGTGSAGPAFETRVVGFGEATPLWTGGFAHLPPSAPWRVEIPAPGPVATEAASGGLRLSVPASRAFDQWLEANDAPRMMRPAPEGDWSYTVRLETAGLPRGRNAQAGIALHFTGNDFLFFGPHRGENVMVERTGQNNLASWSLPSGADTLDLRIRTSGRTLWFDWRPVGGAWSAAIPLSVEEKPREIGLVLKTWEPVAASAAFQGASAEQLAGPLPSTD